MNDQQTKPIIRPLHEAQLITMHGNGMLFRGYENEDGTSKNRGLRAYGT